MWRERLAKWLLKTTDYHVESDFAEVADRMQSRLRGPAEMQVLVWKARGGFVIDMTTHDPDDAGQVIRTSSGREKYSNERIVLPNDATGEDLCRAITQLYVTGKINGANS